MILKKEKRMMNEIETISKIKREKLDEREYFTTLIQVAYDKHMLTESL